MDSVTYSYRDRQMQDLDNHRRGCGITFFVFMVIAIGVFLCSLIDDHYEIGLILAGVILLIGGIIIGVSFKEYLKKLKEINE